MAGLFDAHRAVPIANEEEDLPETVEKDVSTAERRARERAKRESAQAYEEGPNLEGTTGAVENEERLERHRDRDRR